MTDGTNWDCGEGRGGQSQTESDKSDGVRIALFTLLNNRGLGRLSELGGSERGRTGQTVSDRSDRESAGFSRMSMFSLP